jgi:hypothetical protein
MKARLKKIKPRLCGVTLAPPAIKLDTRPLKLFAKSLPKHYNMLAKVLTRMPAQLDYAFVGWTGAVLKLADICDHENRRFSASGSENQDPIWSTRDINPGEAETFPNSFESFKTELRDSKNRRRRGRKNFQGAAPDV